ncbi:hypothetical protein LPJ66_008625, partial [Kickxella alabastrina]
MIRYTEKEKQQRKYECEYCKKRFSRPSSLMSHGYTHTGERPFACDHPGCTKRFSVLSNLRRHNIVHTRKRTNSAAASAAALASAAAMAEKVKERRDIRDSRRNAMRGASVSGIAESL